MNVAEIGALSRVGIFDRVAEEKRGGTPMQTVSKWSEFYEKTKRLMPSPLLVSALKTPGIAGKALDLGAGGLRDTRYLLSKGFDVTAVDADAASAELACELKRNRLWSRQLESVRARFEDFPFPRDEFGIINAQYSLPFTHPWYFERVFKRLYDSLQKDGVFVGQFFGNRDSRCSNPRMTFLSWKELFRICGPLKIRRFEMREYDGKNSRGETTHWHVFDVIAHK